MAQEPNSGSGSSSDPSSGSSSDSSSGDGLSITPPENNDEVSALVDYISDPDADSKEQPT